MKRIREKFILVLTCIMILNMTSLNCNAESFSTEEKINYVRQALLQEEIPECVIERMSTTVILNMYEKMQEYDFYVSDVEEKVVEFIPAQGDQSMTPYSTISPTKMSITTMYVNYVTGTRIEEIECYFVSEWLSGPFITATDGLAMNWDSTLFALEEFAAIPFGTWSGAYVSYTPITRAATAVQGGYGINIPLNCDWDKQGVEMTTFLVPRNPLYTTSEINSNINYEYGHQTLTAIPTVGFGISGLTVSIQPSVGVDTAADTIKYYTGGEIVSEDW